MEFKHKKLLDEFNRQVQSGEYEKGWWKWQHRYSYEWIDTYYSPNWCPTAEYRYTMTEKHPDNPLLGVGDIVKSWYFTSVIAKIDNKPDDSEKYFAVIIANEGTYGKASGDYIGQLFYNSVFETREQLTKFFDNCEVIKKKSKRN
jgi:hypothetical protein